MVRMARIISRMIGHLRDLVVESKARMMSPVPEEVTGD